MTSIVICSIDDAKFAAAEMMYSRLFADEGHELIRIADARSLAEGYNRALRQARGQRIIFSHDDIEVISPDLPAVVASRLDQYDLIGVAGTSRLVHPQWLMAGPPDIFGQVAHAEADGTIYVNEYGAARRVVGGIQALDGVFMAARTEVARRVGFDEATFDGFHLYDIDFSFRAHLAGFRLAVCCDICVIHRSVGVYDATWERFADRFARKHAGRLAPFIMRPFRGEGVKVRDSAEAAEVMRRGIKDEG
jgi:GT2 family glycosyltransferase